MFKKITGKPITIFNYKIPKPIFYGSTFAAAFGLTLLIKEWTGGPKLQNNVDADGKVVIVTGANTGIGKETARDLAKRNAKVYLACRDLKRCEETRTEIVLETKNKYVYCRKCDLASLDSIRQFVAQFKSEQNRLDVLINNAGVMRTPPGSKTKEGFEMQLGVNHLGHFLLTNLLLDVLKATGQSRIVNVSSVAHRKGSINVHDLNSDQNYDPAAAYSQSKLANILFTIELAKRLKGTGVTVNAVHPGIVSTEIVRHMSFANSWLANVLIKPLLWPFIKSPNQGAYSVVYLALSSKLTNITGQYFSNCEITEVSEAAKDEATASWLWAVSEKWTRLNQVSMMTDPGVGGDVSSGVPQIKKELEGFQECSPSNSDMYSPTTTVMHDTDVNVPQIEFQEAKYDSNIRSPGSPERQYCSSTTQPHTDSGMGHMEDEMKEEDSPRRLCLVCGDVASGFHYGVASCEACKAFFKRTIQGNIEYTCPASGECEINKRRRKACQACRFRKCLRSGMLKEGVRLDRVRGGRQKYRRNPDSPYQVQVVSAQRPMLQLEDIKMLDALAICEPDCLEINTTLENSKHRTLSILSDLYDRELVGIIGWAKQIPGFTDLSLNDQMRLLQSTWAEILTLTLAYRSVPLIQLARLKFATDFTLDEKQSRDCGALELYQTCCHVVERLDSLSILKEEYYLLKALVLANSDVRLDEFHSLKKFRDSILSALSDTVGILRPTAVLHQIQQLLLVMPALRQADQVVRRFWSDVHQQELVPMNKLFLEMLEAYCR